MKFSLLVFVLTSFVLNACGLLNGDPAPGRSPGPPDPIVTTSQQNNDVQSTTSNIYLTDYDRSIASNFDEIQHKNRHSAEQPNETDITSNSRHTEHTKKPHAANTATTHHKYDKLGKAASKTGNIHANFLVNANH